MELTWRGYEFTFVVRRKIAEQREVTAEALSQKAGAARRDAESRQLPASGCRPTALTR
jgi:hypothetical protein